MATLELALLLLATVLASAVIDQLLPRLPLPLIQIACGLVVALIAGEGIDITLNPELFLVLFIAPLLFNESKEADKASLWHNRHSMLSYAIGLVVAIVLVVGFIAHAFIPSIPLAAAFALGAALGPTDPIAVASVKKRAAIPERQQTVLQGESLLNDASGIVSFQFAIAAVVTGSFSAVQAVGQFVVSFFGAIIVGMLLGYALVKVGDKVRDFGLENTTFHVALELLAPFIAYLLGEAIGVSGVILVVACGITSSMMPRDFSPVMSRTNIVSSSVWQVLSFALNGIVFVMLGSQLPGALNDAWSDAGISNVTLLLAIVVITVTMHGIRFVWTLASEARVYHGLGEKLTVGQRLRSALLMTFAGSKGAVTLAIMFSIPHMVTTDGGVAPFPQRDLLVFLACGVILLSLLLATFAVPLIAPRRENPSEMRERDNEARADVFRAVIEELTARQTPKNRAALGMVIEQYNDRLERFKDKKDLEDESDTELRLQVLDWEEEFVVDLIDKDEVPPLEGYQYLNRIERIAAMMRGNKHRLLAVMRSIRRMRIILRKLWSRFVKRLPGDATAAPSQSTRIMRDIQIRTSIEVIERLKQLMAESDMQSEKISQVIREYERALSLLRGPAPSVTALTQNLEPDIDAVRLSLRIELEQIQRAYDEGRLSRAAAQKMRQNVYLMQIDVEDYV